MSVASPRRMHYGWVVFGVTFLTLVLAAGQRSSPGVLLEPLQREFGWSRASISVAVSINVLLYGFMGPFAAALLDRFGLRRVVPCALALVAAGAGLSVFARALWQLWFLWGVVVGIGTGCMAVVLAATVANRWFVARRGLVSGVLSAGAGTGQVIFLQVLTRIADHSGWRWVPATACFSALAAIPLVLVFLRNLPSDVGLLPYGAPADFVEAPPRSNPIRTAFRGLGVVSRSGAFWLLFGSFLVCGLSTYGLIAPHFIAAAGDHRITRSTAAGLLALVGLLDIAGTIMSGWLTDRVDSRRLLFAYYGLRGVSLLLLEPALSAGSLPLWGFVVFYGLDWVATVPPTIRLCADACGREWATVAFGWVLAGHQLGAALAAWGAGYIRDVTGSYRLAWIVSAICCFAAAFGVLRIGGPKFQRSPKVAVAVS